MGDTSSKKTAGRAKTCRCNECPYGSGEEPESLGMLSDAWCQIGEKTPTGYRAAYVPAFAGKHGDCSTYKAFVGQKQSEAA